MPKRPRRLPACERREQLLRTAMECFAKRGFRGVTTRRIAHAAGVTEALLFQHFATKDSLYSAIIDAQINKDEGVIEDLLDNSANVPTVEVLTRIGVRFLGLCQGDSSFVRLLLFSALEGHPLADMFYERRVVSLTERFARFLVDRAGPRGSQVSSDVMAPRAFFAMLFYFVLLDQVFCRETLADLTLEERAARIARLYLHGIDL